MPNTFLTGNPYDHLVPNHDAHRDHHDPRNDHKKIDVEVVQEGFISETRELPKTRRIDGGFVLTQMLEVEKTIHLKGAACLLEKKLPVQLAVICFKTKDD